MRIFAKKPLSRFSTIQFMRADPQNLRPWFSIESAGLEHLDGLFSYAVVLTHSRSEAEDLVYETYSHAREAVGQWRSCAGVRSRLFAMLRNLWLDHSRGFGRRRDGYEHLLSGDPKDVHGTGVEEKEQVRRALQELPLQLREVILLREYLELSYGEISSVLDCTIDTVKFLLGKARAKLRKLLAVALWSSNR